MPTTDTTKTTWSPPPVHRLVPVLMARWKAMIIGAILGLLVAIIALAVTSSKYQISASLMFQLGREMAAPPTLGDAQAMPVQKRPEDLATAVEMMSSQHLMEQVVDSFGEDFFYGRPPAVTTVQKIRRALSDAMQKASETASDALSTVTGKRKLTRLQKIVVAMTKDLNVELARRSDVVNISITSSDPDKGQQLLAKFIDAYREEHLKAYQTPKAREFFEAERDRTGKQLAEAEAELTKYKSDHDVFSGEDQRKLLLAQQDIMGTAYASLLSDIARVEAQSKALEEKLAALPKDVQTQSVKQRNTLLDTLRAKLAEAETNKQKLLDKFADDSRPVLDAQHEIDGLKQQIADQQQNEFFTASVTSGSNDTRKALEGELLKEQSDLVGLRAQAAEKQKQFAAVTAKLQAVDAAEVELVRRTRDIQVLEQAYKLYAKNLEDARIGEAMDTARISNIAVIEPPTASLVPVYPNAKLWLIAGAFLGAVLPLALGVSADALRPAVRSGADIQSALGAPTLARVPEIRHWNGKVGLEHYPAAAEEFTRLCAELRTTFASARTILVTAAAAGDGTTKVASSIARGLATDHHCRTLLIDANTARPSLHQLYGQPLAGGLRDGEPAVRSTDLPTLSLATAGERSTATAAQVVAATKSLLASQQLNFDVVVIDAADVTGSAVTRAMLPLVDGVLLVVEADRTRLSQLAAARELLNRAGARLLGAVLNRNGRYLPRRLRVELEGVA